MTDKIEHTLVMLKPDCLQHKLGGVFLSLIEHSGLKISNMSFKNMSKDEACSLYDEHRGKWYFERNVKHVSSGPVLLMNISGVDAVNRCRKLVEDFRDAHKDLVALPKNLIHATPTHTASGRELQSVGLDL